MEIVRLRLQVYKGRLVAAMKMLDDGFEEKVKERKKLKHKMLVDKGLVKKNRKRKRNKGLKKENNGRGSSSIMSIRVKCRHQSFQF